jgi:uncharacterized damage-inducible protein DinB
MFNEAELLDAITELSDGKHTIQNCERLAAVYTVLDHIQPQMRGYSTKNEGIDEYGDTEFLRAVSGKDERKVFALLDELMEAIQVLNPKLYRSFLGRLEGIV